jgi:dTDP-4-dehydrorhamnose reductase
VFHLGGPERLSRVEFGEKVARAWQLSTAPIEIARLADSDLAAARPADVSLDSTRASDELDYDPAPIDVALSDYAAMYPDGAI